MAQKQEAGAKQSLIARVFGSQIAQALGIFGVAFSLFQGLEPFLKFSRLMAYLVNHWRELTRGLWTWLASLVHLELPPWVLDGATFSLFVTLLLVRGILYGRRKKHETIGDSLVFKISLMAYRTKEKDGSLALNPPIWIFWLTGSALVFIIVLSAFLTMHVHGFAGLIIVLLPTFLFLRSFRVERFETLGILIASERTILALFGLLALNYLALHSHTIDAFVEKATQ
jgi:hypothetical protein